MTTAQQLRALADAIRLGSEVTGQQTGKLGWKGPGGEMRTCALGAAYLGATGRFPESHRWHSPVEEVLYEELYVLFPVLKQQFVAPYSGAAKKSISLCDIIAGLNDRFDWPRERIAAWVTLQANELDMDTPLIEQAA